MNDWLQKQMQSGFSDLKGLSIDAHVPVKAAFINELLAEAIKGPATPSTTSPGNVDLKSLLKFVEKAEVNASEGVIVLDVAIKI